MNCTRFPFEGSRVFRVAKGLGRRGPSLRRGNRSLNSMRSDRHLGDLGTGWGHRRDTFSNRARPSLRFRFLLGSINVFLCFAGPTYRSSCPASPLGKWSLPGKRKAVPERDQERLSKLHAQPRQCSTYECQGMWGRLILDLPLSPLPIAKNNVPTTSAATWGGCTPRRRQGQVAFASIEMAARKRCSKLPFRG